MILAVSYGAREELVLATRAIARDVRDGNLDPQEITEETIGGRLYTAGIPDPDLLIRTSGEMRVSNFFLWQIAYSELVVVPTLWPDFGEEQFVGALEEFQGRQRRFGRTEAQAEKGTLGAAR